MNFRTPLIATAAVVTALGGITTAATATPSAPKAAAAKVSASHTASTSRHLRHGRGRDDAKAHVRHSGADERPGHDAGDDHGRHGGGHR